MKNWKWTSLGAAVLIVAAVGFYQYSQTHKQDFSSQELSSRSRGPSVGIFYFLWHCPVSSSKAYNPGQVIPDSSQASIGAQEWAGIPSFHWWGQPADGFYCLAENEKLLIKHAELLRDAGIEFIYIDSSNWTDRKKDMTEAMVVEPFEKLMQVWSKIPGAPKVVPFVPINGSGTLATYFDTMLTRYPQMAFQYKGKPLFLAVRTLSQASSPQYVMLQSKYTLRSMWGLLGQSDLRNGHWSFIQPCQKGFLSSKATKDCEQGSSIVRGELEQTSVSMAYQDSYMSNYETATPKFFGKTFLRQMQTAFESQAQIITITSWNEWIAQRFCPDGGVKCDVDHFPNGNKVFVDQYTYEYNRDIEPSVGQGTYYYDLMKRAVALIKSGNSPMNAADMIKPSQVQGIIDSIEVNKDGSYSLLGWACAQGLNDSIAVHVYAGGVAGKGAFVSKSAANFASEPAVGQACQSKGQNYRFRAAIPAQTAKSLAGKAVYMYAISPYGYEHALLSRSGEILIPGKK